MLPHVLDLHEIRSTLGIPEEQAVQFLVEADEMEDRAFSEEQFEPLIAYLRSLIEDERTLTLNVTWDEGSDYFDMDSEVRAADSFLIDLLQLEGWEAIC